VHDGVDAVGAQGVEHGFTVTDLAYDQWCVEHSLAKSPRKIVEDNDPLAASAKLENGVAADVARAAGD
jgi:hypothetical protein